MFLRSVSRIDCAHNLGNYDHLKSFIIFSVYHGFLVLVFWFLHGSGVMSKISPKSAMRFVKVHEKHCHIPKALLK